MIAYYMLRRWRTRPCPRCQKRVKRGATECRNCEAKLQWRGGDVALADEEE